MEPAVELCLDRVDGALRGVDLGVLGQHDQGGILASAMDVRLPAARLEGRVEVVRGARDVEGAPVEEGLDVEGYQDGGEYDEEAPRGAGQGLEHVQGVIPKWLVVFLESIAFSSPGLSAVGEVGFGAECSACSSLPCSVGTWSGRR